jgi:arylsulfatase A-like enzyme
MDRRQFLEALGLSTAALGTASLSPPVGSVPSDAPRPNIVFLFSDDHSVPDLGCYSNEVIRTPNLDALADEGLRFDRAYVTSPQCSPSRASLLTGRTPHAAGASRLHADAMSVMPSLVGLLNDAGYFTGAYRKVHQAEIQEQFDFYHDDGDLARFFEQRRRDQPFFLWFGCRDPHRPYSDGAIESPHDPADVRVPDYLPNTSAVRQDLAHYYDEIARFDRECGTLLDMLDDRGLAANTMVVMAGDNGLPFPRAKGTLYEPGIRVPLLVRWPNRVDAGRTTDALVSLLDLPITWLHAAGMAPPETVHGTPLQPLLTGEVDAVRDRIYAERNWHDNWDPMRCVVGERYKLIQNYRPEVGYQPALDLANSPTYAEIQRLADADELSDRQAQVYTAETRPQVELYDLEADPGEWDNLASDAAHADRVRDLQLTLSRWMDETHDFLPPPRTAFPGGPGSELNTTINPLNGTERG